MEKNSQPISKMTAPPLRLKIVILYRNSVMKKKISPQQNRVSLQIRIEIFVIYVATLTANRRTTSIRA